VFVIVGSSLVHDRQLCCRAEFSRVVVCDVRACDHELVKPSLVVVEVSCVLMWSVRPR
jgi:hypothetical protein